MQELSSGMSQLPNLTSLAVEDNLISTVPTAVLRGCTALHTIKLRNNPITMEVRDNSSFLNLAYKWCVLQFSNHLSIEVMGGRSSVAFECKPDIRHYDAWQTLMQLYNAWCEALWAVSFDMSG